MSVARAFTLPNAEELDLTSASGAHFRVCIAFPRSYATSDRSYPVLYVLDADYFFAAATDISRLRAFMGELPEMLVVGIGHPVGTPMAAHVSRRTFEFSTSRDWDPSTRLFRDVERSITAMGESLRLGGAAEFLRFVTDDVQVLVNDRYRADAASRALFGYSYAGNFGIYALFSRPDAFTGVILASPGFLLSDWDVFRLEEAYARDHTDLTAVVYLGAGSAETLQWAHFPVVSGMARMAETLQRRGYPSLQLECEFLPGRSHYAASFEVLQRGLEVCFPGEPYAMTADRVEDTSARDATLTTEAYAGPPVARR